MKTRVINCAKVTRSDWDDWTDDQSGRVPSVFNKLRKLIQKSAPEKHATMTIKDKPTNYEKKYKPSSLCVALTKLRKKGVRVLDFERGGDGWQIKTMVET